MNKRILKGGFATLALALLTHGTFAQKATTGEGVDEVIITRKGNNANASVTVEVKGDKIIVNGKPLEEFKGEGITVKRRKVKDATSFIDIFSPDAVKTFSQTFSTGDLTKSTFLGVVTEEVEKGVRVESVSKDSPAEKAGFKEGDIIKKIGDKAIKTPDELSKEIKNYKAGDKVSISIERNGKEQKLNAELGEWKGSTNNVFNLPLGEGFNFKAFDLETMFKDLPKANGSQNFFYSPNAQGMPRVRVQANGPQEKIGLSVEDTDNGEGVKVLEVEKDGNAAKAGFAEGDILLEIDGTKIKDADHAAKLLRDAKTKTSVAIKTKRGSKTSTVEVKMPRKLKKADL